MDLNCHILEPCTDLAQKLNPESEIARLDAGNADALVRKRVRTAQVLKTIESANVDGADPAARVAGWLHNRVLSEERQRLR